MRRLRLTAIAAAGLIAAAAGPALAEGPRHFRGEWHGGDIHQFHQRDFGRWQGGNWHHGRHEGRFGWWWVVGGAWYFYPQPVYPYPDPYTPPLVVVPAPVEPVAPPTQYWYYCDAAGRYYPYVATCPSGWRPVPATPAP